MSLAVTMEIVPNRLRLFEDTRIDGLIGSTLQDLKRKEHRRACATKKTTLRGFEPVGDRATGTFSSWT